MPKMLLGSETTYMVENNGIIGYQSVLSKIKPDPKPPEPSPIFVFDFPKIEINEKSAFTTVVITGIVVFGAILITLLTGGAIYVPPTIFP